MDREYTNKELAHLIIDFKQEVKSDNTEIKEQVRKTNGRVSAIENREQFNKGFLYAVCFIVTAIIIPILLFLVYQYITHITGIKV